MTFNADEYTKLIEKYAQYNQGIRDPRKFALDYDALKQLGLDSPMKDENIFMKVPDAVINEGLEYALAQTTSKFEAESRPNLETILSAAGAKIKPEELLGLTLDIKPVAEDGKYADLVAQHKQLYVYSQVLGQATQARDANQAKAAVKQIANLYISENEDNPDASHLVRTLVHYHAENNPQLLVEVFSKRVKIMEKELERQFYKADGKELDADKTKDYAAYLLQSVKGKDFADGMYGFAASAYLKK